MSTFDLFCPVCDTRLATAGSLQRRCSTCHATFEPCGRFLVDATSTTISLEPADLNRAVRADERVGQG